jgi:hypothetical protein
MNDIHNGEQKVQKWYDNFNNFIFSGEQDIFNKLITRAQLACQTENLHGDIVECGVFKGSGMMIWMKMLELINPHSSQKVIGFDFFNPSNATNLSDPADKKGMEQVFSRAGNSVVEETAVEAIREKFLQAGYSRFELVKGDASITTQEYIQANPGFRISLLYMDLDIEKPTYDVLTNLWDRVVPGGLAIFDEYAYGAWSEANAVDRFVRERGLTLEKLMVKSPTALIRKPL